MNVHSVTVPALGLGMHNDKATATLPFEAGDAEWVADLLNTFREGDLDAVIRELDALLITLRRAAKARQILATVNPALLREGLCLRATRRGERS